MNLKRQLFEYQIQSSSYVYVIFEFLIISILVYTLSNFLTAVLCFLALMIFFQMPIISNIIAWALVAIWTITAFLCCFRKLSISSSIGVTILVFFISTGLHFGAKDLFKN